MAPRFILTALLLLVNTIVSQAQWSEASGISPAWSRLLSSVTAKDFGFIVAGFMDGEFYRVSYDGYKPVSRWPGHWVQELAMDRNDSIYAGVSDGFTYRSGNGGVSWTRLDIEGSMTDMEEVDGWTYLATGTSLYRAASGSDIFEPILGGSGEGTVASAVESSGSVLLAGGHHKVLRSTDMGASWVHIDFPEYPQFSIGVWDIVTTSAGITAFDMRYRFISTNDGLSFSMIEDEKTPMVNKAIVYGDMIIAAMEDGLYRSTDGGRTFELLLSDDSREFIDVDTDGETIVAITTQTLFFSDNGGAEWRTYSLRESPEAVLALAVNGEDVYATSDQIFRSEDNAKTFTMLVTDAANHTFRDLESGSSSLFGLSGASTILRSNDRGQTWADISGEFGSGGRRIVAFHVVGTTALVATESGEVYYSTDNGDSWSLSSDGGIDGLFSDPTTFGSFNGTIYLATWNHLLKSFDDGATWDVVTAAISDGPIITMAASTNFLYAASAERAYLVQEHACKPLGELDEATVLVSTAFDEFLFAGTAGNGVWASADKGDTWYPYSFFNAGPDTLSGDAAIIHDLALIDDRLGYLVAATESNVWTALIPPTGLSVRESRELPQDLAAHYDHHDGSIHLTFSMPSPSRADIELIDLRGTTMQQLADERLEGAVAKSFTINDLPAGMYFLSVRTDKGTSTVAVPILAR